MFSSNNFYYKNQEEEENEEENENINLASNKKAIANSQALINKMRQIYHQDISEHFISRKATTLLACHNY